MCIYHALINALTAHVIHINLNMIFYAHVEKTIHIKYYLKHTHTKQLCSILDSAVVAPIARMIAIKVERSRLVFLYFWALFSSALLQKN